MRLPPTAHTSRPWRIHELAHDFRVEDVWELPCRGDRDDFARLVALIVAQDVSRSPSRLVRALFAVRSKLGAVLGWDDPGAAARFGAPSLRSRLPADLRNAAPPAFDARPFTSLYLLDDEFAAELANRTVQGRPTHRLGLRWDGRISRPDGRPREAPRTARDRIHGGHQAVPTPRRVPGDAGSVGASLADPPEPRGAGAGRMT
jgi:hypothetical protein